jgi:hypothetical protein
MDNIFSFAILDVPPGPGFISTSPDNNNKLMRSKLNEIPEYVDLNLVNAVLLIMGNDIVAHRIVIGLFYYKIGMACCRKVKLIVSFDLYDILHWLILYVHALCRVKNIRERKYMYIQDAKETFSIDLVWMEF